MFLRGTNGHITAIRDTVPLRARMPYRDAIRLLEELDEPDR